MQVTDSPQARRAFVNGAGIGLPDPWAHTHESEALIYAISQLVTSHDTSANADGFLLLTHLCAPEAGNVRELELQHLVAAVAAWFDLSYAQRSESAFFWVLFLFRLIFGGVFCFWTGVMGCISVNA